MGEWEGFVRYFDSDSDSDCDRRPDSQRQREPKTKTKRQPKTAKIPASRVTDHDLFS